MGFCHGSEDRSLPWIDLSNTIAIEFLGRVPVFGAILTRYSYLICHFKWLQKPGFRYQPNSTIAKRGFSACEDRFI